MQQTPAPRKRQAAGWILSGIALVEILFAVGIFLWIRNGACAAPAQAVGRISGGGMTSTEPSPSADAGTVAPVQPPPASSVPAQSEPPADGAVQGTSASGDLNQVPDPNCVAKAAAGVLNTDQSSAPPSCAPMSPPPELQQAAKQVQNLATPTP